MVLIPDKGPGNFFKIIPWEILVTKASLNWVFSYHATDAQFVVCQLRSLFSMCVAFMPQLPHTDFWICAKLKI